MGQCLKLCFSNYPKELNVGFFKILIFKIRNVADLDWIRMILI